MIKEFFASFGIFDNKEVLEIVDSFKYRELKKNEFFIRAGEKCDEVAFVESGVLRSYLNSELGEETTYCFRFPNDLMAPYSSFITGKPSLETIQAISDSELLVIKKKQIEAFNLQNPKWTLFLKTMAEQGYIELEDRVFQLQRNTALERYQMLLNNQPEYIQQIPLQYLASYLGISQRHLSRIRKEIFL